MSIDPNIRTGQTWRRKIDGVLVEIIAAGFNKALGYNIAEWRRLDTGRKGRLDFGALSDRYELVEDAPA
ncbi:hypothetical protein [Agromyces humi]|uniref:hypothetical protein n=1 Tax=Agromyces humi TaxID=1766800 RepID=UPI001358FA85|nr:hypothetical protein [Agromyces humi]